MSRRFSSADDARRRFDEYARIEPRLAPLWSACASAAPHAASRANETVDAFDVDTFDADSVSIAVDGWCAEQWFLEHIKPEFEFLVGWQRDEGPIELCEARAYDDVYAALFLFALDRNCACCQRTVTPESELRY